VNTNMGAQGWQGSIGTRHRRVPANALYLESLDHIHGIHRRNGSCPRKQGVNQRDNHQFHQFPTAGRAEGQWHTGTARPAWVSVSWPKVSPGAGRNLNRFRSFATHATRSVDLRSVDVSSPSNRRIATPQ
jgi:hypothetical protein